MKTLLRRLYSGEVYPGEEIDVKTAEYRALNRKISAEKVYLQSILSANDGKRLDALGDLELQRTAAYGFENFAYGFRLGAGLMAEALGGAPLCAGD